MARIINVTITYLLVVSTLIVSANECRVREKYSPELWNGNPLKILAFTSDQDGFTCMLNFQRHDNYLFYDQIVLSNNGNKVIRTDHGNIEYLDINSTLNATGWNEFIFSMDDNSTFMVTVRDTLVLNYTVAYPVKTITTYGSNISLCSSPSWAVGEHEAIVIPLYPRPQDNDGAKVLNPNNSSIYFTLSSTASFNPAIKVDGIKRYLTMKNGEMLLSQDLFQPLRLKKYLLEVHTQNQKVNINCKLDNVTNKLMEFQVATVLSDIEISSQGMSFTVELELSSILFTTIATTTPTTTTATTTSPALAVDTNDGTSAGLVVGIIITILALLVLVVIIIFYLRHKRSRISMKTSSLGFHEETQKDNGNYRNRKSEMEIFIDDKNLVSFHEQKQHYDGNYRRSIPEMVTLMGSKDETRPQEENRSDDGNCSRSENDLETLVENVEGARSQEVRQTVAKNVKIYTNNVEKSFERSEDKSFSDDMDELERQSDLKDTATCEDFSENKEQESGVLPPNELQSTSGSSPGNNILRDHPPPIDQRPSLPTADLLQGSLAYGAKPPHVAPTHTHPPLFNPNKTQPPHVTTSKADILDQLSLYEGQSAGYQFQFPQDNSSGNHISLPTHDSQSAGVLTQFHQNDYQQQELGSTGKRTSNRRSNKQHPYVTTAKSDDRDQLKTTAKELLEDNEKQGTAKSVDMTDKKEEDSGPLAQCELLSPIRSPPECDAATGHPSPRSTLSRPKSMHGSLSYGFQSENVHNSHGEKSNPQQSNPAFCSPAFVPQLAVDISTYCNTLSQNTNDLSDYDEHISDESLSISEEEFEDKIYQNQELCMSVIDKVEMYVTKGEYERAIETLSNAITHINQSEVAHDERCKDLIMTLQDQLDDLNSVIEDHTNEHRVQPPNVTSASHCSQSSSQIALPPHKYQSGNFTEHRSDATPILSEAEIEDRINRINEVSSSVMVKANDYVISGEYSFASETLSDAISLINQSELQVTYNERFKVIIRSLQDTLIEVKSGGNAPSPSPRRKSHKRSSLRAFDFRERSRSNSRERSRSNSRERSRSNSRERFRSNSRGRSRSNSRERSLLNHGEKSPSNSSKNSH